MANPLQIVITVDTRSGNTELDGTRKRIESIGPAGQRAGREASSGLSALERQARASALTIRNEFSAINDVVRLAFASAAANAARSAVGVAAQFELAEVGIGAFVKEGENAKKVFQDLKQFSLTSPLDFSTVLKASNQLLALDTAAKDLIPTLGALGGAMFAVTAGENTPERLNDVIIALGQIKSAGALTGEEFRQLRNANIVTLEELADAFGVTAQEFRKAIVDRMVPAAEVIPAILEKVKQRFGRFNQDIQGSAQVAFSNFRDALQQASDDAVREYLPALVQGLATFSEALRDIAKWIRENRSLLEDLAAGFAAIGTAIISYKVATGIASVASALAGMAGGVNPVGLVAAGFGLLAFQVYRNVNALEELGEAQKKAVEGKTIQDLLAGGKTAAELQKMGFSVKQIVEAFNSANFDKAFDPKQIGDFGIRVARDIDARKHKLGQSTKDIEEQQKKIAQAEQRAGEVLDEARRKEVDGLARVLVQHREYVREIGLSAKANRDLAEAVKLRIQTEAGDEMRKASSERVKLIREEFENAVEFSQRRLEKELSVEDEILKNRQDADQILVDLGARAAEIRRDSELRALSVVNTRTIQEKLAVEQQRAEIEQRYIRESSEFKSKAIQREIELEIIKNEVILRANGATASQIADMRKSFEELELARLKGLTLETNAELRQASEEGLARQAQAIRDNNQRVFDGLKRSVEGIFDQTVTRAKSFGQALADAIKLPFLAALKEIVSTRVAAMLFQLFGGGQVGLSGGQPVFGGGITSTGGGGNVLGRLLGLGGAGALGIGGGGIGLPGAPGGTPGFAGPVGGGGGSATGIGALSGFGGSFKGILTQLGNLGRGNVALGPGSTGGALAGKGVGGAAGGALLAGGGLLAFDGLRRGGALGLAETTAGGALIGFKFGGPVGAAIGAGVGALAGTIRLFIKGAEEKLVEKVKSVYGITISRQFARDPLLGIIKQGFGGNIDVGIRSQQVKDLIELYGMSTGQDAFGVNAGSRPIARSFALSGGVFSQQPVFQNGVSIPLDRIAGSGTVTNAGAAPVVNGTIQLDAEATTAFFQGQAAAFVAGNPRAVQSASLSATRQNAGRRELWAAMTQPGAGIA